MRSMLALLLLSKVFPAQAQNKWQPLGGPYGGSIIAFAKDADGNFYAARTDALFRSVDQCMSWSKVKIPYTTILSMRVTLQGTIYLGTSDDGLYWSTNGGQSWNQNPISTDSHTGMHASVVTLAINSSGYVFANNMRSTNGGSTFYEMNIDAFPNHYVFSGSTIYAGTNKGVYKSADNGNNWKAINKNIGSKNITGLVRTSAGRLVALAYNDGIYMSEDEGNTWIMPETPIGSKNITDIKLGQFDYLHATTKDSGAYRSTNQGITWENVGNITDELNTVWASASEPIVLMGAQRGGVFRSTVNGVHWSNASSGITLPYVESLVATENRIFAASNLGIFSAGYNEDDWYDHTGSLPKSIYYRIARGQNNSVIAIAGGNPYQGKAAGIFSLNADDFSWKSLGKLPQNVKSYSFIKTNKRGDIVLAGGNSLQVCNSLVVKMKDSAEFKLVYTDSAIFINDVLLDEEGNIFVHMQDFTLQHWMLRLTDGGKSWSKDDFGDFTGFKVLGITPQGTVYARNYDDIYYFEENTWKKSTGNDWRITDSAMVLYDKNGKMYVLKQDLRVIASSDNGAGGNTMITSPDNDFYFLKDAVLAEDGRLYAATYKGVLRTDVLTTAVEPVQSIFSDVNIWPNPAAKYVNLSYTIKSAQKVTAYIYDAAGRLAKPQFSATCTEGTYRQQLDIEQLPAGMYYVKLQTAEGIYTKKIMVSAFIR